MVIVVGSEKMKKLKNRKLWIGSGILFLISLGVSFYFCMLLTPKIYLEEREFVFALNEDVILPDYEAYLLNQDIHDQVEIKQSINNKKVGKYLVEYKINSFLFDVKELVLVEIVDRDRPIIELTGDQEMYLCPGEVYQEPGYQAMDDYDGNLSEKVSVTETEQGIFYRVIDSSGNLGEISRKVIFQDKESPKLVLKGSEKVVVYANHTYQESGYEVSDNCDSDIGDKVKVSGKVDTTKVGTYHIQYQVTDASGNTAMKTRTVEVLFKPTETSKGVIYLTFDDGPSRSVTSSILDILKSEGIAATFFVIHHDSSLHSLIRREQEEGHTVALHSYTHDYSTIYQSSQEYFSDLKKIQEEVKSITGVSSNIIRFPGGSSNTISRKYRDGIMSEITKEVLNQGYRYFDWNVSSGDAGEVHSSEEVYQNVVNGLSKSRSNVVLMHDFENNYYTLNALRDIIQYGKQNGYEFKRITMDTPMVTHKVVN